MRERRTPAQQSFLESLTPDEWGSLAALAVRQRVAGLLTFGSLPPMPVATRQTLEARTRASAFRVLRYQAEFAQLARAVEPDGVQLLVLKGLHLASSVYPHATMREMNDFDVLVRPEHLDATASAARALGYVRMYEVDTQIAMRVLHHLPRFLKPGAGLEVHWRIAPEGTPPLANPQDLWDRSEPNALADNAFQLCPEDALLHICAHAAVTHFFELGIRPLCDIRALVAKHADRLDWEVVATRAVEWRCERGVALVLRLAQRHLGVEFPPVIVERLARVMPADEIVEHAATVMFGQSVVPPVSEPAGRLLAIGSIPARIRYGWSRVVLPHDELAVVYPGFTDRNSIGRALVHLQRLSRLTRRYAWSLARLAVNRGSESRKFIDRRNALAAWLRATAPPPGVPPTPPDRSRRSPNSRRR